jgi:succinate-semialdehyde dehydrogenase/glutarate-semialdehyde dehydrogenase
MHVTDRTKVLLRFAELLLDRQDEVLDLIQLENGKARRHAFEEIIDVAQVSRYYARTAARYLRARRRAGALPALTQTWEYHHPKGVVGVISPWNYPLTLGISDALPALIAGNAVIAKPDGQTPYAAMWAAELLEEAGLPAGVLQVVTGSGPELGTPLIEHCDFLMFTGSTRVGRIVAAQAAARLTDYSMETRREERDPHPGRCRPHQGGTRIGAGGVLQHRSAVHLDGADVHRRRGLGQVRPAIR